MNPSIGKMAPIEQLDDNVDVNGDSNNGNNGGGYCNDGDDKKN